MKKEFHNHVLQVRCTSQELQEIDCKCQAYNLTRSEYLRQRLFSGSGHTQLLPEEKEILDDLNQAILKVGDQINEIFRFSKNSGQVGRSEYEQLTEKLEMIDSKYRQVYQEIRELHQREENNGDNKTPSNERGIRGPPIRASSEWYLLYL